MLAGAGSGKTSVITHKIAYLIDQCNIPARQIAAVTFTNKAAKEMKERASNLVHGSKGKGLLVSTFHTLGLRIVQTELRALGYKPGFSIFDSEDSRVLLKEILLRDNELDNDHLDQIQQQISKWKNNGILPNAALDSAENGGEQTMALVYQHYVQALLAYNAVDFDDLITMPAKLFETEPSVLARWQSKIRYLLVDEYQDTNHSQYQLVKQLIGDRGCLTVVGDDDQSIYAWRGANPENLSQLQNDFPTLKIIKLEQNYRSTTTILQAANTLIKQNPHDFLKTLWSRLGSGEPIRIIRNTNDDAETERVATEILHQRIGRGVKFRDFAVLYRGNHQAKLLELKLQQHQIPYNISGGTSFFARTEIKDIMGYLRLLVNPDDDGAFRRIINTPRRQIGVSTLEVMGDYASERGLSLCAIANEMGLQQLLSKKAFERVNKFVNTIEYTRQACEEHDPVKILHELIDDIDYSGWLHQNTSNAKIAEKRMENIYFLISSIEKMLAKSDDNDPITLETAINKLVLQDILDRQEEEDLTDRVQLMTLHASKGLEFPYVFVMGFEEEILPHSNSILENNIEEERRLAYVGITRAQKALTLTLAAKRKQFGEIVETTPSRFIEELPQDELVREGFGSSSPESNQAAATETLSNLKNLFD